MSETKASKALEREARQLRSELRDLSRAGLGPLQEALSILRDKAIPEPIEQISRQQRRKMERSAAKSKRHK